MTYVQNSLKAVGFKIFGDGLEDWSNLFFKFIVPIRIINS